MTDRDRLTEHVLQGLTRPQKALSSAWFYDDEGSRLFQQIMALPEYYLTRLEHELLRSRADELSRWIDPRCSPIDLIELGSGDGAKTLSLCQALAQREVDLQKKYHWSPRALAEKLELNVNKAKAVRDLLRIDEDPANVMVFEFGSQKHPRYSDNAYRVLRDAITPELVEQAWREHQERRRR